MKTKIQKRKSTTMFCPDSKCCDLQNLYVPFDSTYFRRVTFFTFVSHLRGGIFPSDFWITSNLRTQCIQYTFHFNPLLFAIYCAMRYIDELHTFAENNTLKWLHFIGTLSQSKYNCYMQNANVNWIFSVTAFLCFISLSFHSFFSLCFAIFTYVYTVQQHETAPGSR